MSLTDNAVWIQDAKQGTIPANKENMLTTKLAECVSDCANNYIRRVFIEVGYWQSNQTVTLKHTAAQYQSINAAFHAVGIKTYAWAEGSVSTPTVNVAKPAPLLAEISRIVALGFDGWANDVESYQGTQAQYIAFENSIPNNYPALGTNYDWGHNVYPNLYTKALVPMFYGVSQSRFELSEAPQYWSNVFYNPKVPVILGMMNRPADATQSFPWNLNQCGLFINTYGAPKMVGVSIYLYEHMSASDWAFWKTWIEAFSTDVLLQSILNAAPIGGTVDLGNAEFIITNRVTVPKTDLTLRNGKLTAGDGFNDLLLYYEPTTLGAITLDNLLLNGRRGVGQITGGHGVQITNANATLRNVQAINTWGSGILLLMGTISPQKVLLDGCVGVNNGNPANGFGPGIRVDSRTYGSVMIQDLTVTRSVITGGAEHGIKVYKNSATKVLIESNDVSSMAGTGIWCESNGKLRLNRVRNIAKYGYVIDRQPIIAERNIADTCGIVGFAVNNLCVGAKLLGNYAERCPTPIQDLGVNTEITPGVKMVYTSLPDGVTATIDGLQVLSGMPMAFPVNSISTIQVPKTINV